MLYTLAYLGPTRHVHHSTLIVSRINCCDTWLGQCGYLYRLSRQLLSRMGGVSLA